MADIANKYAENVSGEFYVDDQCIDCDLCRETAPANFRRSDDGGYSYTFKQPTTPEEEALWNEVVWLGDFVADKRLGLQPWEGPGGFQVDAFVRPIYRREETARFRTTPTRKPKQNTKHR